MLYLIFENPYEFKAYAGDVWLPIAAHAVFAGSPVAAWQARLDYWKPQAGRLRCVAVDLTICNRRSYALLEQEGRRQPGFRRPVLTMTAATAAPSDVAPAGTSDGLAEIAVLLTLPASVHRRLATVLSANPLRPELGLALGLDTQPIDFPPAPTRGSAAAPRWTAQRRVWRVHVSLLETPHIDDRAVPPKRFETVELLHTEGMAPAVRDWLGFGARAHGRLLTD